MRVRLTRDQWVRDVKMTKADRHALVDRFLKGEMSRRELSDQLRRFAPAGTIIDHPAAFRLVQLGVAEPEDQEAKICSGFTESQIAAAQEASVRLERGMSLTGDFADQNADGE